MTEEEWHSSTDPIAMLEFLREREMPVNARKLRLFGTACCRRVWRLLDAAGRDAVEVSERHAEGAASDADLMAATWRNITTPDIETRRAIDYATVGAWLPAVDLLGIVGARKPGQVSAHTNPAALARERAAQAQLLRDVFGAQPLCIPSVAPGLLAWNQRLLPELAESAYQQRLLPMGHLQSELLTVLADALEEAGADTPLSTHLREPGPHVRGCYVVDLLTGRS